MFDVLAFVSVRAAVATNILCEHLFVRTYFSDQSAQSEAFLSFQFRVKILRRIIAQCLPSLSTVPEFYFLKPGRRIIDRRDYSQIGCIVPCRCLTCSRRPRQTPTAIAHLRKLFQSPYHCWFIKKFSNSARKSLLTRSYLCRFSPKGSFLRARFPQAISDWASNRHWV